MSIAQLLILLDIFTGELIFRITLVKFLPVLVLLVIVTTKILDQRYINYIPSEDILGSVRATIGVGPEF